MIKRKKVIFTDAWYDWTMTDENGCGSGTICVFFNKRKIICETFQMCFKGLKQLSNRFELAAIKRGLKEGGKNCIIYSDSSVAVGWIKQNNVRWISREKNKAGLYLESLGK
jgi:ribonuclease HI